MKTENTQRFYRHAGEIYARFNDWRDNDRFYFIPLHLEMTYHCGWVTEMAPDPIPLGTFIRCSLEHPELFQFTCPECGRTLLPYRYNGSPLSGRVDLEGKCECGWEGARTVSGWQLRSQTLKDTLRQDQNRLRRFRRRDNDPATIEELLGWLGE